MTRLGEFSTIGSFFLLLAVLKNLRSSIILFASTVKVIYSVILTTNGVGNILGDYFSHTHLVTLIAPLSSYFSSLDCLRLLSDYAYRALLCAGSPYTTNIGTDGIVF
jgi:hypothetical protein